MSIELSVTKNVLPGLYEKQQKFQYRSVRNVLFKMSVRLLSEVNFSKCYLYSLDQSKILVSSGITIINVRTMIHFVVCKSNDTDACHVRACVYKTLCRGR